MWGEVRLPERISPTELSHLILDLPGSFQLVDIRPPEHFDDYHIPGAQNVAIPELVNNPLYMQETKPIIIVGRDGSIAMAVGGILAQRTQRPVKVLYGGLEAYWDAFGLRDAAPPDDAGAPRAAPPSPAPDTGQPPATTPEPQKRSAGC